ncbi:hypothetical protein KEM55_001471 [Ascosphaera atra]|nr:hypothetical protein KEM55_001471 [Ascosphaera atra]
MAEGGKKSIMSTEAKDLAPPKDDPITVEQLAKCDGTNPDYPTYLAIKGTVFDVSRNSMYKPGGSYHCLACSSLKPEDARADWYDLDDDKKKVLDDWFKFFSKRYNIVGKVVNATNL